MKLLMSTISLLIVSSTSVSAAIVDFQGVASAGAIASAAPNYAEDGFDLFTANAANIFSVSAGGNSSGSDFYAWIPDTSNAPIVLTSLSGPSFNLASLDVGSARGSGTFASLEITGYLSGGGTVVTNVVDVDTFFNLALGWTNLIKVEFTNASGSVQSAIDNLHVTVVPIPAALWLLGSSLALIGGVGWRRWATVTHC